MRLNFVSLAAALVVLASCDATSVDQTKISKMATAGMTEAEDRVAVDTRSLRGYKPTEAEDEERAISASIDDVVKKLNAGKTSFTHVVDLKKLDKKVTEAFKRIGAQKKSYLDKVFVKSNLNKMLTNERYAEETFLEWYALGLSGNKIKGRLEGVGTHFDTLFTQYVTFINRFHGVA